MFFCLFVCLGFFLPTREFFTYMETCVTALQILTYARHLWPLSSDDSLACRTYTMTRVIRLLWLSPLTRDSHTFCRPFGSEAVTTYFSAVIRTLNLPLRVEHRIDPVHFVARDNSFSRASWPHPIFDNIHAQYYYVNKVQFIESSMRKRSETIWYAFIT